MDLFIHYKKLWELTNICKSFGERSKVMFFVSSFVLDVGNTDNYPSSTEHLSHLVWIRLALLATKPSKATPSIVSASVEEEENVQLEKVLFMENPSIKVFVNLRRSDLTDQ